MEVTSRDVNQLNDKWVQRAVEGLKMDDTGSFDLLFYEYEARIFNFSLKLTHNAEDAKEVVQEVFLKVWEKRELLEPQGNFEGFIFTIAKNIVYNKARHRVHETAYKDYMSRSDSAAVSVTEETLEFQELESMILAACEELPPMQRKVFLLSRMDGFNHNEIAEKLNTSNSNIKNHIHKALTFLREHLRTHHLVRLTLLLIVACR